MHAAFLADICQHPADDTPRLIYADWLEDHGDHDRANFIRQQIRTGEARDDWNIGAALILTTGIADSRGLLGIGAARVRRGFIAEITLTAAAFVGGRCGRCVGPDGDRLHYTGKIQGKPCPDCDGTGRTPGHAAALFRVAPIERVVLSDMDAVTSRADGLYRLISRHRVGTAFDLLLPLLQGADRFSRESTLDALAAAALLYGRRQGWPCPECKGLGREQWECKVCGARPDQEGEIRHGKGCYELSEEGGGSEWVDSCNACHGTGHTVTTTTPTKTMIHSQPDSRS